MTRHKVNSRDPAKGKDPQHTDANYTVYIVAEQADERCQAFKRQTAGLSPAISSLPPPLQAATCTVVKVLPVMFMYVPFAHLAYARHKLLPLCSLGFVPLP